MVRIFRRTESDKILKIYILERNVDGRRRKEKSRKQRLAGIRSKSANDLNKSKKTQRIENCCGAKFFGLKDTYCTVQKF